MSENVETQCLLTTEQAAEYLGLSYSTLARSRVTGALNIRYSKIGKAVRYRRSDLDAYIAANLRTSTSELSDNLGKD